MNKFVFGALAVTSAGSLAYAGGDETRDWSKLDRDILSLTSNQGATAGSFGIHGFVRGRGARSDDADADGVPTNGQQDLSGFNLDNARIELNASQGDYGAFISLDAGNPVGNVAALLDAYGTFKIAEGVTGQVGRFKAPFLWSAFKVNDNNQVLLDRTFNGQNGQIRQDGVQLSGAYDQFSWWAALQNGADGVQDKISWTGRAQFNFLGAGLGEQEGAYGASSSDTNVMVGAAYTEDTGVANGNVNAGAAWALDAGMVLQGLSLHAEVVSYEGDVRPESVINGATGVINPGAPVVAATGGSSETPWSATAGYLFTPQVEGVVRYEDLDDVDDTTVWTIGLNYYVSGHNAKWTLQGSRANSDVVAKEADTIAFGLTVGA